MPQPFTITEGHKRLATDLSGLCNRASTDGIPVVEQVAILAQILGARVSDLDPAQYEVGEVMAAIAHNLRKGNEARGAVLN